jgi:hypothetical protein
LSSPSIAESKAGRTVPRWKLRPGPATSAKAPRACALKALNMYEEVSVKEVTKKCTEIHLLIWEGDAYERGRWTSLGKIWGKTAVVLTLIEKCSKLALEVEYKDIQIKAEYEHM